MHAIKQQQACVHVVAPDTVWLQTVALYILANDLSQSFGLGLALAGIC
jgi:hypothetical protein